MATFDEARLTAIVQDLWSGLLRRPADLLPFDDVKEQLRLRHVVDRGMREVPLAAIAGTLGRERDFNRSFLPREDALRSRWLQVRRLVHGPQGFAPVELYQVGDTYFVVDGHHRVSVAHSEGVATIEARVKEFVTPVPLDPDESIEDVFEKRGLADFLETTGLVPEHDEEFRCTVPGGYERMLEHISVHRYYLGIDHGYPIAWGDAVLSWRDSFYRPITARIRAGGLLDDMPGCREADLYLLVMVELHVLREQRGADAVPPASAADHFAALQRQMTSSRLDALKRWWREFRSRPARSGSADSP